MVYLSSFLVGSLCGESVITISEFNSLQYEVWDGCEGRFTCRWGSLDALNIGFKLSWAFTSW